MYGLINVAIRDLVTNKFGQDSWNKIMEKAEVDEMAFVRMGQNDDAVTYSLIGAASEILDLPASDILQAFGQYWTEFTAEEGYGHLLDSAGKTLPEFLQNLDQLHARVGTMYPGLKPPIFECTNVTENSLDLTYRSEREGLDDLVIGLLKGLAVRFNNEVTIDQIAAKGESATASVFHVSWT
ncbi:MAG: heme NO-binding domain-containing protein [Phycisphaerales bacterium]|nr:heme NO-binding domain-containing protein [Phycisphaerales bacterium]|tara:strand:+ start:82 stop:627 length:546 start_codon:yes stop_codon:yes gene_type:complete